MAINRLSNWHKDSNGYFSGDYFNDPDVQVLKVGLYLQDMVGRAALQVQPGSHRVSDLSHDQPALLETRAGDLVIFDVRLNHTGQLPDRVESGMKWAARRLGHDKFHPKGFTRAKDAYWRVRRRPDRLAVFFTYGTDNARSAEFAAKTQMRQKAQLAEVGATGEPACPAPELERALEAVGAACWSEGSAHDI